MMIYFVVLAIVVAAALPLRRTSHRALTAALYSIIVALLTLLPGLRNRSVGTDSGNYVQMFERQGLLVEAFEGSLEPGFFVLSWVAHLFSDNYISVFLVIALLVAACFSLTVHACSRIPWVSVFVFFASGAFAVSINGARQGVAVALVFLGFRALLARRFWWFAGSVALASLFHITAIVALPAYFVGMSRSRLSIRLVILTLGGLGLAGFDSLVHLAGTLERRFATYGEIASEGRGLLILTFLLGLCVGLVILRQSIDTDLVAYDILLDLFILGTIIAAIATLQGTGASGVRRLSLYFLTSEILLWPIVFRGMRNPFSRATVMLAFVSIYLAYFALTLRAFSNLTPYTVNPIVPEWLLSL